MARKKKRAKTRVKGYLRKVKGGKRIRVKGHMRKKKRG